MNVEEMAKVMMDRKLNSDSETFARDLDALITTTRKRFPDATSDEIQQALQIALPKFPTLAELPRAEPIHVAVINNNSFRIFRSPLDGPDFPWFVPDDLFKCFGLSRELSWQFMDDLPRDGKYKRDVRTIVTADGPVTIAPNYMALKVLGAMEQVGKIDKTAVKDYANAVAEISPEKLTEGLPFGSKGFFDWMKTALSREGGDDASNVLNPMLALLEAAEKYGEPIHEDGEYYFVIDMPD